MRDWYPGPSDRKKAITSASKRMVVSTLVDAFWGPRPRRMTGGPSISSDHGGLSRSTTFEEVLFGGFKVIARFIFLSFA